MINRNIYVKVQSILSFPSGSVVKNLLAMQKMWVQSLGQKDPLEKEMTTPLQYSCLGNPMDRGAWWLLSMGLPKSQTQLSD